MIILHILNTFYYKVACNIKDSRNYFKNKEEAFYSLINFIVNALRMRNIDMFEKAACLLNILTNISSTNILITAYYFIINPYYKSITNSEGIT